MDTGGQKSIFGHKMKKFNFSTEIGPKMITGGLKSIFGRKMKNSNFRLKMDPGVKNRFLIKNSKVQFFDQNWPKNGS